MQNELALLQNCLILGAMLFGIGIVGFLSRRNMIVMFLSAEIMLQGVSLSLAAWSRFRNDFGGQVLVLFIIAVAACEAAVGLSLILALFHRNGKLDIGLWRQLREASVPPLVEEPLPDESAEKIQWPILPPAGVAPEIPKQRTEYRRRV